MSARLVNGHAQSRRTNLVVLALGFFGLWIFFAAMWSSVQKASTPSVYGSVAATDFAQAEGLQPGQPFPIIARGEPETPQPFVREVEVCSDGTRWVWFTLRIRNGWHVVGILADRVTFEYGAAPSATFTFHGEVPALLVPRFDIWRFLTFRGPSGYFYDPEKSDSSDGYTIRWFDLYEQTATVKLVAPDTPAWHEKLQAGSECGWHRAP